MKLNQKTLGFTLLFVITLLSMNIRSTELSERAIVQALGVDYNGSYKITAQIYNPDSGENAKNQTKILVGEGENIAAAIEDINRKNSKTLYLSHNSFIALGLECATNQIEETLLFFQKDRETRPDILVVITDKAENLINFTNDEDTTPAQSIAEILKSSAAKGNMSDMRLFEILRLKNTPTSDYLIPVITVGESEISPTGTLCFKQNASAVFLDDRETLGYNFVKGNLKDTFLLVDDEAVTIKNLKTKINVRIIDNTSEFTLNISAGIEEGNTDLISQEIKSLAEKSIKIALTENGCDIFEFGKLLRKEKPEFLPQYKNWSNNQKIRFFVTAECHIE